MSIFSILASLRSRRHNASMSSPAMQHIRQRTGYDCGLTTAAMLANLTYEQAQSADPRKQPITPSQRFYVKHMQKLLGSTYPDSQWLESRNSPPLPSITTFTLPIGRGALLLRMPKSRRSHWVAFYDGCIFDPESPTDFALSPDLYFRGDWLVIKMVAPKDPLLVESLI